MPGWRPATGVRLACFAARAARRAPFAWRHDHPQVAEPLPAALPVSLSHPVPCLRSTRSPASAHPCRPRCLTPCTPTYSPLPNSTRSPASSRRGGWRRRTPTAGCRGCGARGGGAVCVLHVCLMRAANATKMLFAARHLRIPAAPRAGDAHGSRRARGLAAAAAPDGGRRAAARELECGGARCIQRGAVRQLITTAVGLRSA